MQKFCTPRKKQIAPFLFELTTEKTVKKAPCQSLRLKKKKQAKTETLEHDKADTDGEEDIDLNGNIDGAEDVDVNADT